MWEFIAEGVSLVQLGLNGPRISGLGLGRRIHVHPCTDLPLPKISRTGNIQKVAPYRVFQ